MKSRLVLLSAIALGLSALSLAVSSVLFLRVSNLRQIQRTRMLILEDQDGMTRTLITTLPDGAPKMTFLDDSGNARAELALTR